MAPELWGAAAIVAAATIAALASVYVAQSRWNKGLADRVGSVEGRLATGQQRFAHLDERLGRVEMEIKEAASTNQGRFDRIDDKLDRIVDHLLKE